MADLSFVFRHKTEAPTHFRMADETKLYDPTAPPESRPGIFRRVGASTGGVLRGKVFPRLLIMGAFISVILGLGIANRWASVQEQIYSARNVGIEAALEQLDAGALDQARHLAAELRASPDLEPEESGGPAYVLGVAMSHDADRELNHREQRSLRLLAARYLQEAHRSGYPDGRAAHADCLLGKSLFDVRHYAACLAPFLRALEADSEHGAEIHHLLSKAYLRDAAPQLEKALNHNTRFLELGEIESDTREKALVTQAEIEFLLDQDEACKQTLSKVPEDSDFFGTALLYQGRLAIRDGDRLLADADGSESKVAQCAKAQYTAARDAFEGIQRRSMGGSNVVLQALYLLGVCQRKLGEYAEAERQFSRTRRSNYDTPEGLAAGLHEAELQMLQGNDDAAIASFGRLVRQADELRVYSNRWVSLDELQQRCEQAYRDFFQAGDFPRAINTAQSLAPLFDEERATRLQAEAYHAHATQLQAEADSVPSTKAATTVAEARAAWRQSAALFERLARLRFSSRQYPETLWKGAESYLCGHDYRRAVRLLNRYLDNEVRRRHPPALAALGEAYLALDQTGDALNALDECIEFFPKDPHSYRARLTAAQTCLETGNLARAKQLLTDNLENVDLTPRSFHWRESLFQLGQIYFREGLRDETQSRLDGIDSEDPDVQRVAAKSLEQAHASFQKAIVRLTEAVRRDELAERNPFAEKTIEARYRIAESYRQSAKLPLHQLKSVTIETTRNQLNTEIQRTSMAAEGAYQQLQAVLNEKQENADLTERERRMLRNTYFARADVLFDLDNLEAAIAAYATATNRYQHEPEALEAYVQIANCHRQLNRASEARGTLEQAKVVLQQIPPDADFLATTRYSRDEWEELLDWLKTL
jgi:hypothetical protein